MKEHGILFQDEMVRALLRPPGDPLRKTVTRRTSDQWARRSVGDLLWVRECWAPADELLGLTSGYDADPPSSVVYRADRKAYILTGAPSRAPVRADDKDIGRPKRWRPSMNMPRWASRLTLRVVDVRRELGAGHDGDGQVWPLPSVNDAEARREGVEDRAAYLRLWESINGAEYPTWVWRIEFEEVTRG